jgi:sn-glycerol 3-phosphate transport system ATP-binding protein
MNLIALEHGRIAGSDVGVGGGSARCMGLRPEAIAVVADSQRGIDAQVVGQEYLGADLVLRCQVGSEVLTVRAPGPQQLSTGAQVRLAWHDADTHFFGADGLRLGARAG